MRHHRLLIGLGILASCVFAGGAAGQEFIWVRQFGSSGYEYVYGLCGDSSGVYVAGCTYGALPGQTSPGGGDAFVRKYDGDGTEVWTKQFGSSGDDYAFGLCGDSTGVYVAGLTYGGLPGWTSAGAWDAFVRKYDLNGNELWTSQFGSSANEYASGLYGDSSGVYVAGQTYGALPGQTSAGEWDAFVRKYDLNGNELWTRQFGTSGDERGLGLYGDSSGVYVAGQTYGALPGQTSAGGGDAFVRKYDGDGTEVWTKQFGSSRSEFVYGLCGDSSGVYVAGCTYGALPGQTSAGGEEDAFVRKYDLNGNELWTRQFGSSGDDYAVGLWGDSSGVYAAGFTDAALPGQTSAGGPDAFVAKLTTGGPTLAAPVHDSHSRQWLDWFDALLNPR